MLLQEVETDLSPREVLDRAKEFFQLRMSPYAAFLADESESHARFRFAEGELVVGTVVQEKGTLVRGSTSRNVRELSQFLATLAPPEAIRQNVAGPGTTGGG